MANIESYYIERQQRVPLVVVGGRWEHLLGDLVEQDPAKACVTVQVLENAENYVQLLADQCKTPEQAWLGRVIAEIVPCLKAWDLPFAQVQAMPLPHGQGFHFTDRPTPSGEVDKILTSIVFEAKSYVVADDLSTGDFEYKEVVSRALSRIDEMVEQDEHRPLLLSIYTFYFTPSPGSVGNPNLNSRVCLMLRGAFTKCLPSLKKEG